MTTIRKYSKILVFFIPILCILPIIANAYMVDCKCCYKCECCSKYTDNNGAAGIQCTCKTTENNLNKEALLVRFKTTEKKVSSFTMNIVDYNSCFNSHYITFLTTTNLNLPECSLFTLNSSFLL